MPSQRQIDANRRNAQKSTCPQTPEGRAAIRFNALRHGLTAENAVLDNEDPEDFQQMLEAFQAEHQPSGPTENLLVHQLVMAAGASNACAASKPACSISACTNSPSSWTSPSPGWKKTAGSRGQLLGS